MRLVTNKVVVLIIVPEKTWPKIEVKQVLLVFRVTNVIILYKRCCFVVLIFVSIILSGMFGFYQKNRRVLMINIDITIRLQNDYRTINFVNLNCVLIRIILKTPSEK
jgi:hypothetical protein